jgi:hypothetical protein
MSSTTEGSPSKCSPASVRSNEPDPGTTCIDKETFLSLSRSHKENSKAEDLIIDRLANSNLIHSKNDTKSPWLRSPFKSPRAFAVSPSGQLQVQLKSRYSELKGLFVKYGFADFVIEFESCILEVLKNPSQYFNRFHRIEKQLTLSYHHGAALFLLFMAAHFKGKVVAFALEFLLLFEFRVNQKFTTDCGRMSYFLELAKFSTDPELLHDTAAWYRQILGEGRQAVPSPSILFELFKVYVLGNRLFQEAEKTII